MMKWLYKHTSQSLGKSLMSAFISNGLPIVPLSSSPFLVGVPIDVFRPSQVNHTVEMLKQKRSFSPHRICNLFFLIFVIASTINRSACTQDFGYCENEMSSSSSVAEMASFFIPKVQELLKQSVNALSPSVPFEEKDEIELATLIFESMYTPGRVYHSMAHVFNITENCPQVEEDPMLVLSVLFHDVIYYSVDNSFQKPQLEMLKGLLAFDGDQVQEPLALDPDAAKDPILDMTVRLFGLEAGTTLPKFGTNEFLSAIIGVRALSKWLSHSQLTQLAAAIEGTIPFRPASDDGKTAMDRLYDRLVLVAPDESEEWLTKTIHLTASMANCDLSSFDSSNFDFFMDSNWSLVPEFRPALLKEDCPLKEYHDEFLAMEGRTKWLHGVVPNIFQKFRDVPTVDEISAKQDKARANLDLCNDYAQVRRLQLMVLKELVTIAGENPETIPGRPFLDLVLPETQPHSEEEDDEVRKLLHSGRRAAFPFDPATCSLGRYLYDGLGKKGVDDAVALGKESGSSAVLSNLPIGIVEGIASSLADVLPERSEVLSQISDKIGGSEKLSSELVG